MSLYFDVDLEDSTKPRDIVGELHSKRQRFIVIKLLNASLIFDILNHRRPTDAELHCPGNNENIGLPRPGQRSASFSSLETDCS